MKKKVLAVLATFTLTASILTGCGGDKVTKETVYNEMQTAMKDVKSFNADMKMNADVGIDMEMAGTNVSTDFLVTLNADMGMVTENESDMTMKIDMDMTMEAAGENEEMSMAIYMVQEGDTCTMYMYDSTYDYWSAQSTDPIDFSAGASEESSDDSAFLKLLTLESGKKTVNGVSCYVLSADISFEDIMKAAQEEDPEAYTELEDTIGEAESMLSEYGLSDLTIPFEICVNADTYELVSFTVDMTKVDLDSIVKSVLGASLGEDANVSLDVRDLSLSVNFSDFNNVSEITVPEEALAAADYSYLDDSEDYDDDYGFDEDGAEEYSEDDYYKELDAEYSQTNDDSTFSNSLLYLEDDDCYVLMTKNITDEPKAAEGLVRLYDADDNLIDVSYIWFSYIPANGVLTDVIWNTEFDHYTIALQEDSWLSDGFNCSIAEKEVNEDSIIFDVTNEGENELSSVTVMTILYKDGTAVGYSRAYSDYDVTIAAGDTISLEVNTSYYDYDTYETYVEAY